jgi:AraC-like DNA-binding protein
MEPRRNNGDAQRVTRPAVAAYREFAPCKALRRHVYAFFSFSPAGSSTTTNRLVLREALFAAGDSFWAPLFADGNISIVLGFGRVCDSIGRWRAAPAGPSSEVIGPMTVVGSHSPQERPEMVGVYFRAAQAWPFLHVPISELTDRIIGVDDVWGSAGAQLRADLSACDEAERLDGLEAMLIEQLQRHDYGRIKVDTVGLASSVVRCNGRVSVNRLASAAGVSRQYLTRAFHERVGIPPKTFCSLTRFQSSLTYARHAGVDWAQAADALGYADQSHMIAEFRRFSGMTPQRLAGSVPFHPFIWRARERSPESGARHPRGDIAVPDLREPHAQWHVVRET